MVCLLREKNQLEQVQICSKLEIILTFSRKCLFYRIFTLPIFTLHGNPRATEVLCKRASKSLQQKRGGADPADSDPGG